MKQSLNLSLGRKQAGHIYQKIYIASISIFCLTVLISVALLTYRLIVKNMFDSLEVKEQEINNQLLSLQEKKDKFIETKKRLDDVKTIISKRLPITARIDTLYSVIPFGSDINSFSGSGESFQMQIASDNLASLNDLLEQQIQTLALDKKKAINTVVMNSFSLSSKTQKYSVGFTVTFNK